ncbi:MAG: HAD-IIIA family hydrolase, partial [Pseudobutyrivibrio sp.]|nr:HAD-IIIA family hydrolase [Pseudobutyrivibrio sp.]
KQSKKKEKSVIPEIKMFLTDCDGVLTDGGMYYSENGDELKKFNTKDGMGFSLLRERGIITGIITGEDRELNLRRAKKLKIDEISSGVKDKKAELDRLCQKYNVAPENVAYIGDDINDIEVIKSVGLGCAVKDAAQSVLDCASLITKAKGGQGAVREVIEMIIR